MKKFFSFLVISFFAFSNNVLAHDINAVHSHGETTFKIVFISLILFTVSLIAYKSLKTEKK